MSAGKQIVVGTDGSPHAASAVTWAAGEAHRLGMPLRIVTVFEQWADVRPHDAEVHTEQEERAMGVLADAKKAAQAQHPDLEVEAVLRVGDAVEELTHQSIGAHLVVTGSRGRGGFAGMVLGSTSRSLTIASGAPLVIVPEQGAGSGPVVVGVDGSEQSDRALAFAAAQAHSRGVALKPVRVVTEPPWFGPVETYGSWLEGIVVEAENDLEKQVGPIRTQYPDLQVHRTVMRGHPADALREAGKDASMLVVGSRGRSTARSMLLGSISHGVLHHAPCPVAVLA
ncbi:universal stress protein [Pseudactinotalea sp. Z1732]|uniref:universal stress protein n=2 Tax=Micrococcales TaxID=85006 RepID=UPI003C7A0165